MTLRVVLLTAGLLASQAAFAETHIFIVDGSDGYGIDRCLAAGEACGAAAAASICESRDYAKAIDYGRLDPAEVTGGVPNGIQVNACKGSSCPETVAVTCSR